MRFVDCLKESFIEAITFSGSFAFAIFLGYLIFSWDLTTALFLGGSIWLVFFFVMFFAELSTKSCKHR